MCFRSDPFRHAFTRCLCLLLFGSFLASHAAAAVCVHSGDLQALEGALEPAIGPNAVPVSLKLEQGTYPPFNPSSYFRADVSIVGGYVPGHDCDDSKIDTDASKTLFSYSGSSGGFALVSDHTHLLKLNNVTIKGGTFVHIDSAVVVMSNVRVNDIVAEDSYYEGPVMIGGFGDAQRSIKLVNVQLDHINVPGKPCSVVLAIGGHASVFINHLTTDISNGLDFCINDGRVAGSKHVDIWNSILWDSTNSGATISTRHDFETFPIAVAMRNVDYTEIVAAPVDPIVFYSDYPSIQQDPQWMDPAVGNYTLTAPNSPALNAGTANTTGGEPFTDIAGNPRYTGSAPDMGAYESPYNDYAGGNVFNVTNTNDVADPNSPLYYGSLRWAITQANANSGPSLIQFLFPSCPSMITLNSPLPTISGRLTLNGYSAAGSRVNSAIGDYVNSHLCVAIQPGSVPTTPSGFVVASSAIDASLTVKGLGFGPFTNPIQLLGGHDHLVAGNQFGGVMSGLQLFGTDGQHVLIDMTGPVLIGGNDPADRNVFLNAAYSNVASGVGVGFGTNNAQPVCQIVGNMFGIAPDGLSADANTQHGIFLIGSGCLVSGNRIAGTYQDAILIYGGQNHVIQNNVLGPGIDIFSPFSRLGAGIRIGGSNNTIGALAGAPGDPSYYGNFIAGLNDGGVLVGSGSGNTVRGNEISANGAGLGLNIDLGLDGLTPNDVGDADTGANGLQNYPVTHGLAWSNGPPALGTLNTPATVQGVLSTAPGQYQVDVYFEYYFCPVNHPGGGTWVGSLDAVDVPGGAASVPFSVPVTIPVYQPTIGKLSVVATSLTDHSTSEFSRCISVDAIFTDSFSD